MNRKDWMLVLLSFMGTMLGVTGAFMLDSWKENRNIRDSKNIAIRQISEEIKSNLRMLDSSYNEMKNVQWALGVLRLEDSDGSLIIHSDTMRILQSLGDFFVLEDSANYHDGRIKYSGGSKVTFEYYTLSDIAWETAHSKNILGEFGYNCLYEMEAVYKLQYITQTQLDKTVESLGAQNFEGLSKDIDLLIQFEKSLLDIFKKTLKEIENCQ